MEDSLGTQLNAVDRELVARLQENARTPLTHVAADIGLSEAYVRRRLKVLQENDVLTITAVADPRLFGLHAMAWIGIEAEPGKPQEVADALLHIVDVGYIVTAVGRFNVMAEVACESTDHLYDVVLQIRRMPSVRRIETFTYLRLLRQQFVWSTKEVVSEKRPSRTGNPPLLDELDRSLIHALQANGRASFRELAYQLGASQRTISARYSRLVETGALRISAVIKPSRLGLRAMSWIGLELIGRADLEEVGEAIGALPEVSYLVATAGRYDLMAEVVAADHSALIQFVQDRIASIPGVGRLDLMPYTSLLFRSAATAWSGARTRATDFTDSPS